MRKKLSEMTPFERVRPRLEGLTLEEAEDVAVNILAQIVAKRVYLRGDYEYMKSLILKIAKAGDRYYEEHRGCFTVAKVGMEMDRIMNENKITDRCDGCRNKAFDPDGESYCKSLIICEKAKEEKS